MARIRYSLVLVLLLMTGAGCTPLDDLAVAVFGRSMRTQSAIQTHQDPRLPAEGAVSFASGNFPGAPGEIAAGQPEGVMMPPPITRIQLLQGDPIAVDLENPISPDDPASLARGQEVYERTCVPCHGAAGDGDGPVTEAGMLRFTLVAGQALEHSDGYLYSIIRVGRGAMPAYGHQITHFDRWHVVNYVRQLQELPLQEGGAEGGTGGDD